MSNTASTEQEKTVRIPESEYRHLIARSELVEVLKSDQATRSHQEPIIIDEQFMLSLASRSSELMSSRGYSEAQKSNFVGHTIEAITPYLARHNLTTRSVIDILFMSVGVIIADAAMVASGIDVEKMVDQIEEVASQNIKPKRRPASRPVPKSKRKGKGN
jgi:hypothetical protein